MAHAANQVLRVFTGLTILALAVLATGCGVSPAPGVVVGNRGVYNYSPSVIQTGAVRQFWWCSQAQNPQDPAQISDAIFYESIDMNTGAKTGPKAVLTETPNAWDAAFTCNPQVIGGSFLNPLGDGQNFSYAMYYVATASPYGVDNSIGVAFSRDGETWVKYPNPVILSTSETGYGVGQPAPYNSDGKQGIWLFYEDDSPGIHHVKAVSTDGVHFTVAGSLTMAGLDPNNPAPSWGDIAYDSQLQVWYAIFNLPPRNPATIAGLSEPGQYGFEIYQISAASLLTGAAPWRLLATVDTNSTGYESNFIPGFLRDSNGNVNIGSYPSLEVFTSISYPPPSWNATPEAEGLSGGIATWMIGSNTVTAGQGSTPVALTQYFNGKTHESTTGWLDPGGHFQAQALLGHLYSSPQGEAATHFYNCKDGNSDYFVSLDPTCEGQHIQGSQGFGYSSASPGAGTLPLYSCYTGHDHFLSHDASCSGASNQGLLGYVSP